MGQPNCFQQIFNIQMPGHELLADEVANMLKNLYYISNQERLFCPFCEVRLHNDNLDFCFVVLCILILMEELHFACTAHSSSGPSLAYSPYYLVHIGEFSSEWAGVNTWQP